MGFFPSVICHLFLRVHERASWLPWLPWLSSKLWGEMSWQGRSTPQNDLHQITSERAEVQDIMAWGAAPELIKNLCNGRDTRSCQTEPVRIKAASGVCKISGQAMPPPSQPYITSPTLRAAHQLQQGCNLWLYFGSCCAPPGTGRVFQSWPPLSLVYLTRYHWDLKLVN